jgi:hypothetical protein
MVGGVADDGHRGVEFAFGNQTVRDKDKRSKIGQRGGNGIQHDELEVAKMHASYLLTRS